jgi:glutamyl-tRNA synthetase
MGIKGDVVSHTSDHFQELYDSCVKVIKLGKAYADDTEQAKVREILCLIVIVLSMRPVPYE